MPTAIDTVSAGEVAVTIDDPSLGETPLLDPAARDEAMLRALSSERVVAALFVCGMRIDHPSGIDLLSRWDEGGHSIANHSYSHWNYHADDVTFESFSVDCLRMDPLLSRFGNVRRWLRFPLLKEGNSISKRDRMRGLIQMTGYNHGRVTIDASDWYINTRLAAHLATNPDADVDTYRQFYLDHLWDRTRYYDSLARRAIGRPIKHTVLLHHNLLNALFLGDVLRMYRQKGWTIITPDEAFADPIHQSQPTALPAGESLVWALARESGRFEAELRYPAEDADYEKDKMDQLRL